MKKILAVVFVLFLSGCHIGMSEGERVGELVKVSRKGLVFKTWEIQLKISESGELFSMTADLPETIEPLKKLLGKKVAVTYIQLLGNFPWEGDSQYKVRAITKKEP